jgi:hypothetical protein
LSFALGVDFHPSESLLKGEGKKHPESRRESPPEGPMSWARVTFLTASPPCCPILPGFAHFCQICPLFPRFGTIAWRHIYSSDSSSTSSSSSGPTSCWSRSGCSHAVIRPHTAGFSEYAPEGRFDGSKDRSSPGRSPSVESVGRNTDLQIPGTQFEVWMRSNIPCSF